MDMPLVYRLFCQGRNDRVATYGRDKLKASKCRSPPQDRFPPKGKTRERLSR